MAFYLLTKHSVYGMICSESEDTDTQREGSEMSEQEIIRALEEIGGREWRKADYHRVYFNADTMAEMGGLKLWFYNTGNISGAELNGETISNSEAKRIMSGLMGFKVWYDLKERKWLRNGDVSSHARAVFDQFLVKAKATIN